MFRAQEKIDENLFENVVRLWFLRNFSCSFTFLFVVVDEENDENEKLNVVNKTPLRTENIKSKDPGVFRFV